MASSTARSVKMRLRACTLHLRTCGQDDRDARSAEHKNTIIAMLQQGPISAAEVDDLLGAVTNPQLEPIWKAADLHAIAQAVENASVFASGRCRIS